MSLCEHQIKSSAASEQWESAKIGIMADSHGDAALIDAAAARLRAQGCARCFHLGDACDTTRPHTAAACLQKLQVNRISSIRGNNEQALLHHRSPDFDTAVAALIRAMPLTRRIGPALQAHSLPIAAAMGARCMIEDLDADHLRRFFLHCPGTLLFRGHNHRPEIVRSTSTGFLREKMMPARP